MAKEAYYCTVKELNKLGRDAIPAQLRSNTHLIYSSPATLAFNSPGAEGFGVKRAGLAVPDSIMLIVAIFEFHLHCTISELNTIFLIPVAGFTVLERRFFTRLD